MKANSKEYIRSNFPDLLGYKSSTSRMWESKNDKTYLDNWWFKLDETDLEKYKYIIFAGALDYENKKFEIFKIPSKYILDNINKIDVTKKGWINIYLSFHEYIDLRNKNNLSFKQFIVK